VADRFFEPPDMAAQAVALNNTGCEQGYTARNLSLCSTRAARALIDYGTASSLRVLPLGVIELGGRSIFTAAAGACGDAETLAALKFSTGMEVKLVPVPAELLQDAIFQAYHGDEAQLAKAASSAQAATAGAGAGEPAPLRPPSGEAASFLASLIEFAAAEQASDIHLIPMAEGSVIRLRIGGRLRENECAINNPRFHQQLITRLKVLANLDVARSFAPIDGRFAARLAHRRMPVRLSLMPTVHGEKAVLRLFGAGPLLGLDDLGMRPRARMLLETAAERRHGALLFCGPTGSGKTSSMYAMLRLLRAQTLNIITIEDPVEIEIEGISQTSIDERHQLGYSECLRSVLRQDPDVIMLGEIRDRTSADMALHAALSGHLVLSTVHARTVFDVYARLGHFGLDPVVSAGGLSLLLAQRLVPRLCAACKVIDLQASRAARCSVYQAVGCSACDYSGYDGRVLAVEALSLEGAARDGGIRPEELRDAAGPGNYLPLKDDLRHLLENGRISWKHFALYANSDAYAAHAP